MLKRLILLASVLILVGCGDDDDDGGGSSSKTESFLADDENLTGVACYGVANQAFTESSDDGFGIEYDFNEGQKFLMETATANAEKYSAYLTDGEETGATDFDILAEYIDVDCEDYESGVYVLTEQELFSDDELEESACTLENDTLVRGASIGLRSSTSADGEVYQLSLQFRDKEVGDCPLDKTLSYERPAGTFEFGETTEVTGLQSAIVVKLKAN